MTTSDFKIKHDFLKHDEGYNNLFEDKPVDVEKNANLLKFEITVKKHGDYYDFENSKEVVDDFLKNVRSQFKPFGLKLRQNILSKVIVNDMSGSSWKFRRFVMIRLKVLDLDREIVK